MDEELQIINKVHRALWTIIGIGITFGILGFTQLASGQARLIHLQCEGEGFNYVEKLKRYLVLWISK